jgi:hypothetical protein
MVRLVSLVMKTFDFEIGVTVDGEWVRTDDPRCANLVYPQGVEVPENDYDEILKVIGKGKKSGAKKAEDNPEGE